MGAGAGQDQARDVTQGRDLVQLDLLVDAGGTRCTLGRRATMLAGWRIGECSPDIAGPIQCKFLMETSF